MRVLVYKGIFSRFILDHFLLLEFLTMHQMVDDTQHGVVVLWFSKCLIESAILLA